MKRPTLTQAVFYSFVFLSGFQYQPNWVHENFWANADFYDSIPFDVSYFVFLFIYSSLLTYIVWASVKFAKSRL
jgi:hypothetical protein